MKIYYNFRTDLATLLYCLPYIAKELNNRNYFVNGIIIASDGDTNSNILLDALSKVLCDYKLINYGVCTSPAIAYECIINNCSGIMITASHCATQYTGLKIYDRDGYLLSAQEEDSLIQSLYPLLKNKKAVMELSDSLLIELNDYDFCTNQKFPLHYAAEIRKLRESIQENVSWIVYRTNFDFLKKVINCSRDEYISSSEPDPEKRVISCFSNKFVVSIDADGDKCIVYYNGKRINENLIIFSLAVNLKVKELVTNRETHPNIIKTLKKKGIRTRFVRVGDQFILDYQKKQNEYLLLGAEANGHYIMPGYSSPDGVISSLLYFLNHHEINVSANYSKAVFEFDNEVLRKQAIGTFFSTHKTDKICEYEYVTNFKSSLIYFRLSMWENSVVSIIFDDKCTQILDALIDSFGGTVSRRLDYVEV